MKKISVIIPAYNVEKYIGKCLETLVNQTLEEIEIIVVNDGSVDHTIQEIKKIQKKYPTKIVLIDQKNKGVSIARNIGIEKATGEYIGFIDSDDYVEFDMYEKMYQKAKEKDFDMVTCDVMIHYPDHDVYRTSGIDHDCYDLKQEKQNIVNVYAVIWNKIYKRKLLLDTKITFKKDVWYEDILYLYSVMPNFKTIGVVKEALNHYVQREGSITHTYNDKLYHLNENCNDLVNYYKEHQFYQDYYQELEYLYVRYHYATFIKRLAKTQDKKAFNKGVNYVLKEVNKTFPDYKKNRYLEHGYKNFYIKHFNKVLSKVVYHYEKKKMN